METHLRNNMKLEEQQSNPIKLLLEKFGMATSRFIKGEITRERREGIYDEVYLGIKQLGQSNLKKQTHEAYQRGWDERGRSDIEQSKLLEKEEK